MPPEFWLTTDRLALRRFAADDFDWFAELNQDVEVTRYTGGVKDRPQARDLFNGRILTYYDENPGLGIWMTVERATGEPVGYHLINHIAGETIIQIGYTLKKSAWGRGFATEGAAALLRYGFLDLNLPRIVGMTDRDNVQSQRVLEKIGLRRNGERAFSHPAYAAAGPMAWFEADREGWLARYAARP